MSSSSASSSSTSSSNYFVITMSHDSVVALSLIQYTCTSNFILKITIQSPFILTNNFILIKPTKNKNGELTALDIYWNSINYFQIGIHFTSWCEWYFILSINQMNSILTSSHSQWKNKLIILKAKFNSFVRLQILLTLVQLSIFSFYSLLYNIK